MATGVGAYRERIIVQSATKARDTTGQNIKTWSTFKTIWARVQYQSGGKQVDAQKANANSIVRFTTVYRSDITTNMRVSWRGQFWNINEVLPNEDKQSMQLGCSIFIDGVGTI